MLWEKMQGNQSYQQQFQGWATESERQDPLTGAATKQQSGGPVKNGLEARRAPLRTELLIAACNGPGGEIRKAGKEVRGTG